MNASYQHGRSPRNCCRWFSSSVCAFMVACSNQDALPPESVDGSNRAAPIQLAAVETEARRVFLKEVQDLRAREKLEQIASEALADYLFDPASAQFRQLRAGRESAVCGKVNAKNRYGAYVGFKDFVVLTPGSAPYVSDYNDGVESAIFGEFATAYLKACATPEEKKRHSRATSWSADRYSDIDANMDVENLAVDNLIVEDPFAE